MAVELTKLWVFFSESGQNETFVENETLVPHLFSDICIYSGSHRRLIGQKPNENFLTRSFSEKNLYFESHDT